MSGAEIRSSNTHGLPGAGYASRVAAPVIFAIDYSRRPDTCNLRVSGDMPGHYKRMIFLDSTREAEFHAGKTALGQSRHTVEGVVVVHKFDTVKSDPI